MSLPEYVIIISLLLYQKIKNIITSMMRRRAINLTVLLFCSANSYWQMGQILLSSATCMAQEGHSFIKKFVCNLTI
jgi:hypothetical protein